MTPYLAGAAIALAGMLAVGGRVAAARERTLAALGPSLQQTPTVSWPETITRLVGLEGARPGRTAAVLIAAASSVICGLVGQRLAGLVGGAAGVLAGAVAVRTVARARAERERARAELQLADFVAAAATAVRAGLSVRRALHEASRDVEAPLRPALDAARDALVVGEPLDRALDRLAPAVGSKDSRLLAALLSVHARTGGDLPRVLDDVAEIVRRRIEARRSVRTLTAQGRASGAVLAVLPVAFVVLLSWTSGDGLGAFYRTPLGAVLLGAGLACEGLGFLWIRRIVEVPVRER